MNLLQRFKRKPKGKPSIEFTIRIMAANDIRRIITVWSDGETATIEVQGQRVTMTPGSELDVWPWGSDV